MHIDKAHQAIAFGALADKTYGDAPFTVSATGGGSGEPVMFAAAGNCSVSGSTVTITGAGSCTVTASQAGNINYYDADNVAQTFSIAKATPTITASDVTGTYNGNPFPGQVAVVRRGREVYFRSWCCLFDPVGRVCMQHYRSDLRCHRVHNDRCDRRNRVAV